MTANFRHRRCHRGDGTAAARGQTQEHTVSVPNPRIGRRTPRRRTAAKTAAAPQKNRPRAPPGGGSTGRPRRRTKWAPRPTWRRITSANSSGPSCPLASQRAPSWVMLAKSESVMWMHGVKSCDATLFQRRGATGTAPYVHRGFARAAESFRWRLSMRLHPCRCSGRRRRHRGFACASATDPPGTPPSPSLSAGPGRRRPR